MDTPQVVPKTIQFLDLVEGIEYECVSTPEALAANFSVGIPYVCETDPISGCPGLVNDFGILNKTSLSTFIPVVDDYVEIIDTPADSIVNQPYHYAKWKIEPITFIMENGLSFEVGNIVKYAVRAGSKMYEGMDATESEITDLEKVRRYAEMRINQLKGCSVL